MKKDEFIHFFWNMSFPREMLILFTEAKIYRLCLYDNDDDDDSSEDEEEAAEAPPQRQQ